MADDFNDFSSSVSALGMLSRKGAVVTCWECTMSLYLILMSSVTEGVLGPVSEGDIYLLIHTKESTVSWVSRPC